jgi:transposase
MAAKHTTPDQKAQIVTLRAAGYSISSIADRVSVSVSTVKRISHSTSKGSINQELMDEATKELIDTLSDSTVKSHLASLVQDDLALSQRIRSAMFTTLEQIEKHKPSDACEAGQIMRALSSAATTLKLTSDTLRQSLGVSQRGLHESNVDDLPELIITTMTGGEMAEIRKRAESLAEGFDDGMGGILVEENEVITEGFDEAPGEPEAA